MSAVMKLAERPARVVRRSRRRRARTPGAADDDAADWASRSSRSIPATPVASTCPPASTGLLVQRVEPVSPAAEAGLERGQVLLHVNRRPGRDHRRRSARCVDQRGPATRWRSSCSIPVSTNVCCASSAPTLASPVPSGAR